MKPRHVLTAAGFLVLAGVGAAVAQTVVIAPEQETVIREYIVRQQVEPVPDIDFDITVGSIVPDDIVVRRVEAPELTTEYEYVVLDGRTVLVEPGSRRIVHIID